MHEQAHVMLRPQQDGPPKPGILPCDNGIHPEQGGRCGFQRIAIDVIMLLNFAFVTFLPRKVPSTLD